MQIDGWVDGWDRQALVHVYYYLYAKIEIYLSCVIIIQNVGKFDFFGLNNLLFVQQLRWPFKKAKKLNLPTFCILMTHDNYISIFAYELS